MPAIQVGDISMEYSIDGTGEPLVLVAGLSYSRWCWHRMIPALSKKYQVISFDNRGVGGTDRTPGPYSAELMAKDTAGLMDALGIWSANIVGISMGGFITQALSQIRPDLFSRMILMSTGFGGTRQIPPSNDVIEQLIHPSTDPRERAMLACAPGFDEKEKDFFHQWLQYRMKNPIHPEAYRSQLAVGLDISKEGNSFEKHLALLKIPTLILFGELDRMIPSKNGDLLHELIKDSQLVVLSNVAHFLPFECPENLTHEIHHFIESTPSK
ncbi:MAG: hypothetical protein COT73_11605 [Bdellovibrio sp. CG10_big_fil_rev_8_21_14_0_10_47_8]|nr:MAG: hypothetical protein COT73_11605 [Bdellovibrio sp. CG10_big_fil_rev_8_21_14_0_10_47_8]